jgi:hypothetical protein
MIFDIEFMVDVKDIPNLGLVDGTVVNVAFGFCISLGQRWGDRDAPRLVIRRHIVPT